MHHVLVKDAVTYLVVRNSDEAKRLRRMYPGAAETAMFNEALAPLSVLMKAQIDVAISALNEILSEWITCEQKFRMQSVRANTWGFIGAALAVLGSGTALTLILGGVGVPVGPSVAAAIGLIGALVNAIERYLRQDLFGQKDGLTITFRALIVDAAKASSIVRQLPPFVVAADDGDRADEIYRLLTEANELVVSMQSKISSLPR